MTKALSVKIDDETWREIHQYEDVNWSGVIRQSIRERIAQKKLQKGASLNEEHREFNRELALSAIEHARRISKLVTGRKGEDIIREWRDKRK